MFRRRRKTTHPRVQKVRLVRLKEWNNFFNNPLLSPGISSHATLNMTCLGHFFLPLCRGSRRAGTNLCWCHGGAEEAGAADGWGGGGVRPNPVFTSTSADCWTNRRWVCVRQGSLDQCFYKYRTTQDSGRKCLSRCWEDFHVNLMRFPKRETQSMKVDVCDFTSGLWLDIRSSGLIVVNFSA